MIFLIDPATGIRAQTLPQITFGTTNLVEGPESGTDSVDLAVAPPTHAWVAASNEAWLLLSAENAGGTGSANLTFAFDSNPGATRTGTITVAGRQFSVTQAGSNYRPDTAPTTLISSGFLHPQGVAVDGSGNVYVADTDNNAIKKWSADAGTVTTLVSFGLNQPNGVAVDVSGNVYIADSANNEIKRWLAASRTVTTLVSRGLHYPEGVAVDGDGNLYIADTDNNAIKKWSVADGAIATLISSGLQHPQGVAVDGAGNLYIADTDNNAIRKWSAADRTVTTLVSSGLKYPRGVAVDGAGNLFIADTYTSIKKWWVADGTVSTPVSSGLSYPQGVAVDGAGNIYIADTGNSSIEEVPRGLVDPTAKVAPAAAGIDVLPAVLPATVNLTHPWLAPTCDQPWLTITGVTGGVVSYAFATNGTGAPRTAHITLLGQSIPVTQAAAVPAPPVISTPVWLPAGSFQFNVAGEPGAAYSVFFSTNVALPLSEWMVVGSATNTTPGQFHFTGKPPAGVSAGFYLVR